MTTSSGVIPVLPADSSEWQKNVPYAFNDLIVVIEYLAGDERKKVKSRSVTISNIMPAAYGFIVGTNDQHGEGIDIYIASSPDFEADVYVIDQVEPATGRFDEHKVMLGFSSADEALLVYSEVFSDGSAPDRIGAITTFSPMVFSRWIDKEGSSLDPASKCQIDGASVEVYRGITPPPPPPAMTPKPTDEAGGVIIQIPDLSTGPKMTVKANKQGGMDYHVSIFSALTAPRWSNLFDRVCRALDLANEKDVFYFHISSPGGSVFLMGRMVSSMRATKAKTVTIAEGVVASAATTIFSAGHERRILHGSYFMQHMSSQLLGGKSSDISAKAAFCVEYITDLLQPSVDIGLLTEAEVRDMIDNSADIYFSGREAMARIQKHEAEVNHV